jgi:hypothetical protein
MVFIGQDLNVVSNVSVGGEIRCIGDVVAFFDKPFGELGLKLGRGVI